MLPHLLIYVFGPGAEFDGRLVSALERDQSVGESQVLDGLFAARDLETGELGAVDPRPSGDSASIPAELVGTVGSALEPGSALLALLIERPEWRELGAAVARTGGSMLSAELVRSSSLAELGPKLVQRLGVVSRAS